MAYQVSSRHSESLLEMDDHLEEIFKSLFRDFIRIFYSSREVEKHS